MPDEENNDADVDADDGGPEAVDEWGNAPDPARLLRKPKNRGVYCMHPQIILNVIQRKSEFIVSKLNVTVAYTEAPLFLFLFFSFCFIFLVLFRRF